MSGPSQHRLTFATVGLLCAVPFGLFLYSETTQKPLLERRVSVPESNRATTSQTRAVMVAAEHVEEAVASSAANEEQAVIEELRRLAFTTPEESLELARSALGRFPSGPTVAERRWYEARALVSLGKFADARKVAEWMLEHHPENPFTADARRHLLSHPFGLPPRVR